MHKKLLLPHKICLTCQKKFIWRKKWRACWEQVLYCSQRCRRNKQVNQSTN
ncbi:DUF2256 domain-containing protein [Colwellia sp. Arc7-D]|uniref:DUF2256 domain-containing protein n=1 Tax=Colwellia sp. Arc7-D TaxID=2161872 RepID=UPI000D3D11AB|nr:DUF2256 domain-containing protein [Colwellia sp. Arc7-D]AWB56642.1 DUF2256 domain-containing protein [Colwellia sp. Arc7-D]